MRRIVWTYGLIAGGIMATLMTAALAFEQQISTDIAEFLGYTTMILAFLMVFFGIRTYRDTVLAGSVRFGQAFKVGLLITLVASACDVAAWQVVSRTMAPDFMERYAAQALEKARANGATEAALAAQKAEMDRFAEMYKNPLVNVGITFLEVFPVGLVVVLVSAGVLSRSRSPSSEGASRA